ncbi:MAG TPA: peptidylprolyl isomerase [Burkholderiales bacterium]|nr:peptidylprolyl isomerase [Burkholderiales bacterium]
MEIKKDTVVSLTYELCDSDGGTIEKTDAPIEYLHGGYDGIFQQVEKALAGKSAGESCRVRLEPDDAFGDYDAELVHLEPRDKFPDNIAVGMQFEGRGAESGATLIYTVTEIADNKVVVDGNHPLAGKTLEFSCTVTAVRAATQEELAHGHVHGAHGHHH